METNQKILPFEINLVRFENPETLVEKSNKTTTKKNILASKHKISLFGSEDGPELTCGDVLNLIIEPRQWKKDDVNWKQHISKQPGTTSDVKKLSEKLDTYLLQFEAKEVGICPIKQELYSQCFNEIIRQVTLNCAERGYMLVMIRDEIKMNIDAYEALYESRIAYGIRKTLLQRQKKTDLKNLAEILKLENQTLAADLINTTNMTAEIEQGLAEKHEKQLIRHINRLEILKKSNGLIKTQLESIISPKKRL